MFAPVWVELKVKTKISISLIADAYVVVKGKRDNLIELQYSQVLLWVLNRFWLSHIFHSSIHQCHARIIGKSFQRELNFVSTFGDFGVQSLLCVEEAFDFWLWFRTVRQIFMSETNSFVSTTLHGNSNYTVGANHQKNLIFKLKMGKIADFFIIEFSYQKST